MDHTRTQSGAPKSWHNRQQAPTGHQRQRRQDDAHGGSLETETGRVVGRYDGGEPATANVFGRAARVLAFSLLSLTTSSIWFFSSQPPSRLRETSLTTLSQSAFLDSCPQPTPITPSKHAPMWETLLREATTGEYKNIAVEWLSGAILVVCVCSQ